jgi:PAS domain S-box-containing protein
MIPKLSPGDELDALLRALESAGIGCTVVVDDGQKIDRVYANEPIAKIFGLDVAAMRALPPMGLLTPEEHARLSVVRAEVKDGGPRPPFVETTIVRPDGVKIPVEVGMAHLQVHSSNAMFVFLRDISEKTKMEAALRESESRFRSVAETSPDSIAIYKGGRYVYANPVSLRVLGKKSFDEIEGVDAMRNISDERREEIRAFIARARNGGPRVPPLLSRTISPEGKELLFESTISVLPAAGEPTIIAYSRDITERDHLQAELMKQDRLASVGILAAGVAHELNNPLTTVTMQAKKLRSEAERRDLPSDIRAGLEQIDEAATRLQTIINDLLFVARPSERPQAHIDVAQIIASTVSLFRAGTPRCPPIDVTIASLPPICGHASKLGQVVLNVLRNAAQALDGVPNGEIRVNASVISEQIEIEIKDNGPGIPREDLPRVTQPFFTTKQNGTGLGLWISHTLVAEHGGTLDVASRAESGTRVTIRVPIAAMTGGDSPANA